MPTKSFKKKIVVVNEALKVSKTFTCYYKKRTHYEKQILFQENISIFNFVILGRIRKHSNFCNFGKFKPIPPCECI